MTTLGDVGERLHSVRNIILYWPQDLSSDCDDTIHLLGRRLVEDSRAKAFAAKFSYLSQGIHISAELLFAFVESAETKARKLKQGTKPWVREGRRDIHRRSSLIQTGKADSQSGSRGQWKKCYDGGFLQSQHFRGRSGVIHDVNEYLRGDTVMVEKARVDRLLETSIL